MKRVIALICSAVLMLSVTACGSKKEGVSGNQGLDTGNNKTAQTSSGTSNIDSVLSSEITGEITVYCYDPVRDKQLLEEAAKAFEEEYPGTKVNVEAFAAMPEVKTQEENGKTMKLMTQGDDSQSKNDYINKVNTELMSGKGADVLTLDVLPFYKYAENEQLENLQAYMDQDPDFNRDDYRSNIFDAISDEKGQYILPIGYSFNYFAYDSSLFDDNAQAALLAVEQLSFEQIIELGKESFSTVNASASEPITMFGYTDGMRQMPSMFSELFSESYSNFVNIKDKKANFTDGMFVDLLNTIKEYGEVGYLKRSVGGNSPMTPEMFEKNRQEKYFFKKKDSMSLLNEFNKNSNIRIMSGNTGDDSNDKVCGIQTNDKRETPFSFTQAYGINTNSTNKQTAWAFIKFLTSEKVQESTSLMGLPININAFLEKTKLSITGALYSPDNAGKELDESGKAIFDSYVASIERYTSLLNTFLMKDATIDNIVNTEVRNYFEGTKSAEEVAEILQNKVSLYLNE